jgi:hypothetical protein
VCHIFWHILQQDSISPRLRRCASEERGSGGAVAASAGQPETAFHAPNGGGAADADVMYVTAWGAVAYLFIASAVLVALFFMLDYINALIVRVSPSAFDPAGIEQRRLASTALHVVVALQLQLPCLQPCKCAQLSCVVAPTHLGFVRRWRCSASAPSRPSWQCCGWGCRPWRPGRRSTQSCCRGAGAGV